MRACAGAVAGLRRGHLISVSSSPPSSSRRSPSRTSSRRRRCRGRCSIPARLERADRRARRVAGVYSETTIEPQRVVLGGLDDAAQQRLLPGFVEGVAEQRHVVAGVEAEAAHTGDVTACRSRDGYLVRRHLVEVEDGGARRVGAVGRRRVALERVRVDRGHPAERAAIFSSTVSEPKAQCAAPIASKPLPVTVTVVPPCSEPLAGEMPLTFGGA